MRARNIVLSVLGASVFAVAVFISWLMWPLPSAQFDWRQVAEELVEQDNCSQFGLFIYNASLVDPAGVTAELERHSLAEWCPSIDDSEFFLDESPSDFSTRVIAEGIALSVDFDARYPNLVPGYWNALREALSFWREGRELRRTEGLSFFAWPEFVLGFRCERVLDHDSQAPWYNARLNSGIVFYEPNPLVLAPWEARRAACSNLAAHEAERIDQSLDRYEDPEQREDLKGLAFSYRTSELRWRPITPETVDPR